MASFPIGCRRGFFAVFLLVFGLGAAVAADGPKSKAPPGADIFDADNIVRIEIIVSEAGWRALSRSEGSMNGGNRPQAKVTVTDGTTTYTNVALQLKGAAGSFRRINDRPAMTLNFDKHVEGQNFHGLRKLSLNNSVQDRTYLSEKISRELFEAAGVPAPRADYALVTLNGRNLGLYVLVEGFNKQFLRRYYKDVSGNLYDGGFCQEVSENLNINSGDNEDEHPGMRRMIATANKVARNPRATNALEELSKVIDIDRFLTFMAMEIITCHWDGYTMNKNNYRVYHDKDSDKMVFMPHGMDQVFGGGGGRGDFNNSIMPRRQGYIAAVVMATPEGQRRYAERFWELRTNVFNVEKVTSRVREIGARLPQGMGAKAAAAVNSMCARIEARGLALDRLALRQSGGGAPASIAFNAEGVAKLTGWSPRTSGAASFNTNAVSGKAALNVVSDPGTSSGAWRARAILKPGSYIFEGMAKTTGVRDGENVGANLRVSKAQPGRFLQGNSDWTRVWFAFELEEETAEVEFICELRGSSGEVSFDRDSLRLRRLTQE